MPGRLLSSFRSGNLAEAMGILLLKGIAAVAEVARPEDVGLDAIATLLRFDDAERMHYAEDSFFVQLKSESETTIDYEGHELQWLLQQPLPLFIGRVSLRDSEISLYSAIHVNFAKLALNVERATVRFGKSNLPPMLRDQQWLPWTGDGANGVTVWMGEPIAKWNLQAITSETARRRIYEVLSTFLPVARLALSSVRLNQSFVLNWETNDAASITESPGVMKGPMKQFPLIVREHIKPAIQAIALNSAGNKEWTPVVAAAMSLVVALKEKGFDIDSDGVIDVMFRSHLASMSSSSDGTGNPPQS